MGIIRSSNGDGYCSYHFMIEMCMRLNLYSYGSGWGAIRYLEMDDPTYKKYEPKLIENEDIKIYEWNARKYASIYRDYYKDDKRGQYLNILLTKKKKVY